MSYFLVPGNGINHTSRFKNASFCVSLGSELSMSKMFDSEVWPSGVIVRPFRPAKSNRNRSYISGQLTAIPSEATMQVVPSADDRTDTRVAVWTEGDLMTEMVTGIGNIDGIIYAHSLIGVHMKVTKNEYV